MGAAFFCENEMTDDTAAELSRLQSENARLQGEVERLTAPMEIGDLQKAVIENDCIVIRLPIPSLRDVVESSWACDALPLRMRVTDAPALATAVVYELNWEEENGTTPIHRLFDAAINEAIEQGADGIEVHDDQEGCGGES